MTEASIVAFLAAEAWASDHPVVFTVAA